MATTALITFGMRVNVTPIDHSGTDLAQFTLQVTNCEPTQTTQDIDITNSESGGYTEFAPTIVLPEMNLEGIVDIPGAGDNVYGAWESIWFTVQQNKYFARFEIQLSANDLNTVKYTATQMVKSAKMMGKVDSGGGVWRWSCATKGVSRWKKKGSDVTGVKITGVVQT